MDGNKLENFALRFTLSGHDREIRSVAAVSHTEGGFASICTERIVVWAPQNDGAGYREEFIIRCRCNVVHSLCAVAPTDDHPSGLILVGTDEPSIQAYAVAPSDEPIYALNEHSDIVCSLAAGRYGTVVSGSWDKTAKVWYGQKCTMTLAGHDGAVLSILLMPVGGYMLTGSADSTIKRWRAGKCELTFEGHTDWVRALCLLTQSEFLSCSNDGTIRRWNISGGCLQAYTGHSGAVLDLASLPDGKGFVSVGEDGKMSLWKDETMHVETVLSQQSLSSVCVLHNGNVVTGASDNLIRVFTLEIQDPDHLQTAVSTKKEETEIVPSSADKSSSPDDEILKKSETSSSDPKSATENSIHKSALPKQQDSSVSHQGATKRALPGEYFPETSFITFENLNKKGVLTKLREFSYEASEEIQMSKVEMEHLEVLISGLKGEAPEGAFPALWKLLSWPNPDLLFPALDILRFTMLNKYVNAYMCSSDDGKRFVNYISSILSTSSTPPRNQFLVLRALCNTFQHPSGERLLLLNYDRLASDFLQIQSDSDQHVQVAQSSLLLNFVIAFCRANDTDGKMRCLSGAVTLSQLLTDSEACFRLLVAIGTAVVDDRACYKLARTLDLQNFFNMCCCDDLEKVRRAAESITKRVA